MKRIILPELLLLLFIGIKSPAQLISGLITGEQGKPMPAASVALMNKEDSSAVKYTVTDLHGKFEFRNISNGQYFIRVSSVGYANRESILFKVQNSNAVHIPELALTKAVGTLRGITVIAHKPPVEVKAGKIILNVEESINAVGQDALELLRKSPGVLVDKDNNISMSGKNGVSIYVDGRQLPLAGADLAGYLKTLRSTDIESIEMITNPSSKYEASGNAGIINIRLKKNKSFGTNGTLTGGYNIGIYSKYNMGISVNHREKHFNIFGSYNYAPGRDESYFSFYRTQLDTLFNQHSTIKNDAGNHSFKTGLDYFIDQKNTIGIIWTGNISDNTLNTSSSTTISYLPTAIVDRILVANNSSTGSRNNSNVDLNYRYSDSTGHELNMEGDRGVYHIRNNQFQPNFYYDPSGQSLLYSNVYNMLSPTDITIYSYKADYEQNFKKGRLGIGAKFSQVNSDNDFQQYFILPGNKRYDTLHSNHFDYRENINALYTNYSRTIKGWVFQAGVRMEHTTTSGQSNGFKPSDTGYVTYDSVINRKYTDFFPSGGITFNKNPMKQWSLSYSRRIDRPAYQDLNPFEFKLDEYTFSKGNTLLKPQYTNSIGLTYLYKFKLVATLNYSHVKDVFTQLVDTTGKSKAFLIKQNLATQDITSLNISYPIHYKWYSAFANLNTYYTSYKADFGPGRTVNLAIFSLNIFVQQTFQLGKGWTGELTGLYVSPSIWQGYSRTKRMWSTDAGLQKNVFQNKATVKASVSDLFNTFHWSSNGSFAGQSTLGKGGWESRQFKLSFSYRFGSNQVKAARQHKDALEEESKRVQTQGGILRSN